MKLLSVEPKKLKGFLFKMIGKKATVAIYVIGKMNEHSKHEWTHIDMDDASKSTHYKPKKVLKALKWLKKKNIIHFRTKKMDVKPTQAFIQKAIPWAHDYMNQHKSIKGQEAKATKGKSNLTAEVDN